MDRLFLDANVLFSAAHSPDSRVLWLWEQKGIRLLTSEYALEEAQRNLAAADSVKRLELLVKSIDIISTPTGFPDIELSPGVRLPKKDQPILATAIKAAATHLITGDKKHFGCCFAQRVCGMLIQTPAQYRFSKSSGK